MIGIYIGRFQPLHNLHEKIINSLIDDYGDNSAIIIGSAQILNDRNIFTYDERKHMFNLVYPDYNNIYPLNDYFDDNVWRNNIKKIIYNNFKIVDESKVEIYCGCLSDVCFFKDSNYKIKSFDRKFDVQDSVSATKIREAINNNDIKYISETTNPKIRNIINSKIKEY